MTKSSRTQLAPGLWQGAMPVEEAHTGQLRREGFTMLVLCAAEYQPPSLWNPATKEQTFPGTFLLRAPNVDNDRPLTNSQANTARNAGRHIAMEVSRGGKVLITCQMGWNRSGLVSAVALKLLNPGKPMSEIVAHIQTLRPNALYNKSFVKWLLSNYA